MTARIQVRQCPGSAGPEGRKGEAGKGEAGKGQDFVKGKGCKGKDYGKDSSWRKETADGKPICFKYNTGPGGCNEKGCDRAHVCQICLGPHPASSCPKR